ncbi:MAG: hypothetical protein V3U31_03725, partial [Dehalococcoidia bacterium]
RHSLGVVEARLGDDREVAEAGARVEAARHRRADLDREIRHGEGELGELTRKLTGEEEKLYGGRVTNFKELEDLQRETDTLRQKRQQQEEQLLGLMEQAEAAGGQVTGGQQALEALRQQWQEEQERLAQQRGELLQAIAELEGRREGVVRRIDPASLRLYEDLRRSRQQAVARVEQGRCQGCRVALSMNEIQKARGSIIQCSSCGRILYSP